MSGGQVMVREVMNMVEASVRTLILEYVDGSGASHIRDPPIEHEDCLVLKEAVHETQPLHEHEQRLESAARRR